jgi:hypothetical protein
MLPFFFTHFSNTFFQIASILKQNGNNPEESKGIARKGYDERSNYYPQQYLVYAFFIVNGKNR